MEIASPSILIWTVLVFGGYVLSVCLHEFGHAIVAYWGGDTSVKDKGYLTLNPLKYTHSTYSLWMPLIFLLLGGLPLPGAAVYINVGRLRGPVWRSAVSAAGPLMTGGVAVAIAIYLHLIQPDYNATTATLFGVAQGLDTAVVTHRDWLTQGLVLLLVLEVAGVFLNLIPLPGLDGYGIIEPWLPIKLQKTAQKYSNYTVLALLAAFWMSPEFNRGFWQVINGGVALLGVPVRTADLGFVLFRQGAMTIFVVLLLGMVAFKQWQKRYGAPKDLSEADLTARLTRIDQQLSKHPQNAEALVSKASVLIGLNQYEPALIAIDQALEIAPKDYKTWCLKGNIAQHLQDLDQAIAAHQQVVELNPDHVPSWLSLGSIYCKQHRYEDALPYLDKALDYDSDETSTGMALWAKSVAYFYLERYQDCLDILDQYLVFNPQAAPAFYNQACCYAKLGEITAGKRCLANAAEHSEDLKQQAQTDEDLAPLRDAL